MRIIECIHTQSRCYGAKRQEMTPIGIVVHSTGSNNPSVKRYTQPSDSDPKRDELISLLGVNRYGNHWNTSSTSKSTHYIVGKLADGSVGIVQNRPENIAAWGCGKGKNGSYNYDPTGHIQFEVCEDSLTDADYFRAIFKAATELCADICYRYGWDASVVVSHKGAYDKGFASNHRDIDHWLANFGRTMNEFRSEVKRLLDEMKKENAPKKEALYRVQVGAYSKRENAEAMKERLIADGYPAIIKED